MREEKVDAVKKKNGEKIREGSLEPETYLCHFTCITMLFPYDKSAEELVSEVITERTVVYLSDDEYNENQR